MKRILWLLMLVCSVTVWAADVKGPVKDEQGRHVNCADM